MKKIPTIFLRNPTNTKKVLRETNPECDWVFHDDVIARRKYDGKCCMIKDSVFFKRIELKKKDKIPDGFVECEHDMSTGKRFGWVTVNPESNENKWYMEGLRNFLYSIPANVEKLTDVQKSHWDCINGTYELIGPRVRQNSEKQVVHRLIRHDASAYVYASEVTYDSIRARMEHLDIEGLVFYHKDGRMAKIKKSDFGFSRKEKTNPWQGEIPRGYDV